MTSETLEALKKSIEHWKENCRAKIPDEASTKAIDCALCNINMVNHIIYCEECPVYSKTGEHYCYETPYQEAYRTLKKWKEAYYSSNFAYEEAEKARIDFIKTAQREVEFLESLLPKE